MESGNKPSTYSERGTIGSAEDLDEYGVWVKCEPENVELDDGVFFGDENEQYTEVEEAGVDAEAPPDAEASAQEAPPAPDYAAEAEQTEQTAEEAPPPPVYAPEPEAAKAERTAEEAPPAPVYAPEPEAADAAGPPEEEQADGKSTELLLRIVGELSTIKGDLSDLRGVISTLQNDQAQLAAAAYEPLTNRTDADKGASDADAASELDDNGTLPGSDEKISFDELRDLLDGQFFYENAVLPEEELPPEVDISALENYTREEAYFIDLEVSAPEQTAFDSQPSPASQPPIAAADIDAAVRALARKPAAGPQKQGETAAAHVAADPANTAGFKKDLQVVLSYMDRLLEALPEDKIEEFARSEQFDVYKKVFKELGLV